MTDLDDVVHQALLEGREVRLTLTDGGYGLEVNGQLLAGGMPRQSIAWQLDRIQFTDAQQELVDELLQLRDRHWKRSRMHRLATDAQAAAHGEVLPIHGDD